MKIVFATGIYFPDIGGPATYVRNLASECSRAGHEVIVVTYRSATGRSATDRDAWPIHRVGRRGGPIVRWIRYALALRKYGRNADVVYAFSSVSCALPLVLSGLKKPKRILRLGGDFLWERYTDRGGEDGLEAWYASNPSGIGLMSRLLNAMDGIVFSTDFQRNLYERWYKVLPRTTVIENAFAHDGALIRHGAHTPFRLLFMGRFVGFKNLLRLVDAVAQIDDVILTLVGEGPLASAIHERIAERGIGDRVVICEPLFNADKKKLFREQDLLIIPSVTEISPNTALEARSEGLPVLLTEKTGLSNRLRDGMSIASLETAEEIASAIRDAMRNHDTLVEAAAIALPERSWEALYQDHAKLFSSLSS